MFAHISCYEYSTSVFMVTDKGAIVKHVVLSLPFIKKEISANSA